MSHKTKRWTYIVILAVPLLGSCTARVILKSDPQEAEIYVVNPVTQERKKIGVTPLELPASEVAAAAGASVNGPHAVDMVFEKREYEPERIAVPASRFGDLSTQVTARLRSIPLGGDTKARQMVSQLYLAQQYANQAQFSRAHEEVDKVLAVDGRFPRALSMKGSIYLLEKNYTEALRWYRDAILADPNMGDVRAVVAELEKVKRVAVPVAPARAPASSAAPVTGADPQGKKP